MNPKCPEHGIEMVRYFEGYSWWYCPEEGCHYEKQVPLEEQRAKKDGLAVDKHSVRVTEK